MSLKEKVEKYLRQQVEERKKDKKTLGVSEFYATMAGMCNRAVFYDKIIVRPPNVEAMKFFVLGNLVHDWIQDHILEDGNKEESIRFQEGEITIRGRIDYKDDKYVYELKSCSSLEPVKARPREWHQAQLNLYLKGLSRNEGKVVYVEKNTFEILEHLCKFNEKLYAKTIENFKIVADAIKNRRLPQKTKNSWKCQFCPWQKECDYDINFLDEGFGK